MANFARTLILARALAWREQRLRECCAPALADLKEHVVAAGQACPWFLQPPPLSFARHRTLAPPNSMLPHSASLPSAAHLPNAPSALLTYASVGADRLVKTSSTVAQMLAGAVAATELEVATPRLQLPPGGGSYP